MLRWPTMQTQNRILDELARLANGAAGVASGLREEIEGLIKHRLDRLLADMDLVTREEFDAVKEMAAAARAEQEILAARLAELTAGSPAGSPAGSRRGAKAKTKPLDSGAKPDSASESD